MADAQDFFVTIADGQYDLSQNLTTYDTEFRAYRLTDYLLSQDRTTATFPCGAGICKLGAGVTNTEEMINRILADPKMPYRVTPAAPGDRLFPAIVTPSKQQNP